MNNNKKLYVYSGLVIVASLVAYALITRKKSGSSSATQNEESNSETDTVVTSTGDVINNEQSVIPKSLLDILKGTSSQATLLLKNKPIYTKIDNVKVRSENYVNNGLLNNVMSEVTNSDFLLGNVIEIMDDKGKLKNNEGRVFKWFKIKPTQETLDEMNRNKNFLSAKFLPTTTKQIFVREDVVKLK
jgi:hypothetical protein